VAITSGLKPGERVVIEGTDRLRDGARVELPGEGRPARPPGAAGPPGAGGERKGPPERAAEQK
jgi:multidrug efflux system membrane fusion protein